MCRCTEVGLALPTATAVASGVFKLPYKLPVLKEADTAIKTAGESDARYVLALRFNKLQISCCMGQSLCAAVYVCACQRKVRTTQSPPLYALALRFHVLHVAFLLYVNGCVEAPCVGAPCACVFVCVCLQAVPDCYREVQHSSGARSTCRSHSQGVLQPRTGTFGELEASTGTVHDALKSVLQLKWFFNWCCDHAQACKLLYLVSWQDT